MAQQNNYFQICIQQNFRSLKIVLSVYELEWPSIMWMMLQFFVSWSRVLDVNSRRKFFRQSQSYCIVRICKLIVRRWTSKKAVYQKSKSFYPPIGSQGNTRKQSSQMQKIPSLNEKHYQCLKLAHTERTILLKYLKKI